jgi:hypothetical protein
MEHGSNPRGAYQRSKLANAIFEIELDRRLRAAQSSAISVFAHPGYAATNLQSSGPTGVMKAILAAYDVEAGTRLWQVSEELTGVHYPVRGAVSE